MALCAGLIATKPRRRRQRSARSRPCWRILAPVPRTGCSAASHAHGWPVMPPAWPDRPALRRRPCSVRASPMATVQPLRTSSRQLGSPPTRWSVRTRNFARWGLQQCVRLLVRTAWYLDYGGRDLLGEEPASSPFSPPYWTDSSGRSPYSAQHHCPRLPQERCPHSPVELSD